MLALTEKQTLIRALGQVISDKVRDELAPFRKQLADIANMVATLPPPKDGRDGNNGKDFDPSALNDAILDQLNFHRANGMIVGLDIVMEKARSLVTDAEIDIQKWTAAYVTEQFEKCLPKVRDGIDGKNGEKGEPGKDGKDAPPVDLDVIRDAILFAKSEVLASVDEKIAALPKPEKGEKGDKGDPGEPGKDGRDGTNGTDGKSVSLDELRSAIADLVVKAIGDIPLPRSVVGGFVNRDGRLHLTYSDGGTSDLGEIVGKDGRDCDMATVKSLVSAYLATIEKPKDGKDGLGFDDLQLDFDGERLVQLKFIRGDEAKIYDLEFPAPLFKDIWKEGEYKRGHIVVRDGSMWIAQKDTSSIPGQPDSDWKLCTKRGRDGKDGKAGLKGEKGDPGRPGRDLTQIGPDGSKW